MKANDFYKWRPMPAPTVGQRPKCPQCGKEKAIVTNRERASHFNGFEDKPATEWTFSYPLSGHFCTLRCANDYANAIIDNKTA